ncbi:hypothetical protein GCM10023260_08040 [Bartonella acomydis]|uniref:Uncharacterized protein n=1 Tax=Bartonella acomydis TaxID=686234 RepID=A0ABP9MNN7_9HYPH
MRNSQNIKTKEKHRLYSFKMLKSIPFLDIILGKIDLHNGETRETAIFLGKMHPFAYP